MTDSIFKATHAWYTASGTIYLYKSSTEHPSDSAMVWCNVDWMWVLSDNWDNEDLNKLNGFFLIPDLSETYAKQVLVEYLTLQNPEGHLGFPKEDWQREVSEGDTLLGYWMWVLHQIEAE